MISSESSGTIPATPYKTNRLRSIMTSAALLIVAPLLSFLLTFFVFQTYQVDGMSMETTLQNQDRLLVWKAPQTVARVTDHESIPHRYDIIVFKKSHVPGILDNNSQLIKRVIGLPGERIVVSGGQVIVYNREHSGGFQPDTNQSYALGQPQTPGDIDITVPAGHVFVLGDNRSNSYDSPDFGTVPTHDIIGTLIVRVTPLRHAQTF